MRSDLLKISLVLILLFLISLISFLFFKGVNIIIYSLIIFLVLVLAIYLLGYDRRKEKDSKDVILIILIVNLAYYLFTYITGYFSGFYKPIYSHTFSNILKNVIGNLVFILTIEILRKTLVKKIKYIDKNFKFFILIILILSFCEYCLNYSLLTLSDNKRILQSIFNFIPLLSENILLTYLIYRFDITCSLIYRLMMDFTKYIVPIIPNFGDYINTVIAVIYPFILLLIINSNFQSMQRKVNNYRLDVKYNKISKIGTYILFVFLFILVLLVSGVGRYFILSIGSESMTPKINMGDVVLIDKGINKNKIKVGDVIAFKYEGNIIVHRVVSLSMKNNNKIYKTKGDNNKDFDAWVITNDDLVGKAELRFRYIGWPTIVLNQWIIRK